MYKVTAEYRNSNPVKLVFPTELIGNITVGSRILLADNRHPDALGHVIRCYRTPRNRHIAWVIWDGEA